MAIPSLRRRHYFQNGRTWVTVHREPHQSEMHQHRHEFLELAVILSGEAVHVTGDIRHHVQTGDVLVLSRLRPHGYERTEGLNLLNILIREDTLPRLARDLRHLPGFHALFTLEAFRWSQKSYTSRLRLSATELAQLDEWANRLEEETARPNQGGHVLAEAYLTLIMGLLVRCYGKPSPRHPRPEAGMGRVLSWIEAHLAEPLNVPAIARHAGMSPRSFHRHFLAAVGESPLAYIVRQRVARAKELLAAHPDARMEEIATQCGFEDANYFSRVFRAQTRLAPSDFARK